MQAYLENNLIKLSFSYDASVVAFVRMIDGRHYDPRAKIWSLPLDVPEHILENLRKLGFSLGNEIFDARILSRSLARELEGIITQPTADITTSLPLLPAQKTVTAWMVKSGAGLNRCGVRTGKTYMSLASLEVLACKQSLVIAPTSTLYNWQNKIRELLPAWNVEVAAGTAKSRQDTYKKFSQIAEPKILVISYAIARIDFLSLKNFVWSAIICDEVHHIGNLFTKTHKAIRQYQAKHRFGLSATPIHNNAMEAYGIVNWCFSGALGGLKAFLERYILRNQWGGVIRTIHTEELARKLSRYMVFRPTSDFAKEISPVTIDDIPFDLSEKERNLYTRIVQELLFDLQKEQVSKLSNPMILQNTLTKLGKLLELTDSLELLGDDKTSTKLEILKEKLADCLIDGQKAVIFTRFRRMAAILARELSEYNPLLITGEVKAEDRQKNIEAFEKRPDHRVLISTDAGNEGVSYAAASFIFHYDLPFSWGKYEQRNGRAILLDKKTPIAIYNLIARKTMDEKVSKILARKQNLADCLLNSDIKEYLL